MKWSSPEYNMREPHAKERGWYWIVRIFYKKNDYSIPKLCEPLSPLSDVLKFVRNGFRRPTKHRFFNPLPPFFRPAMGYGAMSTLIITLFTYTLYRYTFYELFLGEKGVSLFSYQITKCYGSGKEIVYTKMNQIFYFYIFNEVVT